MLIAILTLFRLYCFVSFSLTLSFARQSYQLISRRKISGRRHGLHLESTLVVQYVLEKPERIPTFLVNNPSDKLPILEMLVEV